MTKVTVSTKGGIGQISAFQNERGSKQTSLTGLK